MDRKEKPNPLLSVVLPVYNGAVYLREAIESVLAQRHRPLEIILIDDGSTDNTPDISNEFKEVRYIHQNNQGPAVARNRGLKEAQGDIIAFIDADDIWPEDKIGLQLPYLTGNADVDVVIGHIQCKLISDHKTSGKVFEDHDRPFLSYILGSAIFKRAVFERTRGFDESFPTAAGEDVEFFLHARDLGLKMITIKEVTLFYRLHQTNTTGLLDKEKRNNYFLKALKKSIDRRRL